VVPHARRARREDHQVAAALAEDAQLVLLDALAQLVVANALQLRGRVPVPQGGELGLAEARELRRLGRVVAVDVDDQRCGSCST
jgi:hypothetical protein